MILIEFNNEEFILNNYKSLMISPESQKRSLVAKMGLELDTLINDGDYFVRAAVASITNNVNQLDKLSKDESFVVRGALVKRGLFLDKFIKDEVDEIRLNVAAMGYGLDILSNDKSEKVAEFAKQMLTTNLGKEQTF